MKRIVIGTLLLLSASCDRVEYYPDRPLTNLKSYVLGHAGSGLVDRGNTFASCVNGLTLSDGIEIDLQMTADGTLWLSHSENTMACGALSEECFHDVSDSHMDEINACLGSANSYPQLTTIFDYIQKNHPNSFVSLDVKVWTPCGAGDLNVTRNMNIMAQKIIDLTKQYKLEHQIMVESEVGDFLYYVRTNSDFIETYLTTLGDYELGVSRALDSKFSGISFKYKYTEPITREQIDLLHRKGLKIHLWPVNGTEDIVEAKALGADFIQTDTF
jgi:glycerophosphoryl diester phosphodiesterase